MQCPKCLKLLDKTIIYYHWIWNYKNIPQNQSSCSLWNWKLLCTYFFLTFAAKVKIARFYFTYHSRQINICKLSHNKLSIMSSAYANRFYMYFKSVYSPICQYVFFKSAHINTGILNSIHCQLTLAAAIGLLL